MYRNKFYFVSNSHNNFLQYKPPIYDEKFNDNRILRIEFCNYKKTFLKVFQNVDDISKLFYFNYKCNLLISLCLIIFGF